MNGSSDNTRPVGEEQLLDWIDGRLSPAEQARLVASSGRAGLEQRVRQMRANKRALESVGVERAPSELMERVVAALERDALLGLSEGLPAEELAPIQITDHVRAGRSDRWSRVMPGLALAAGLVLLVGGGLYWSTLLFAPPVKKTTGDVALADRGAAPAAVVPGETAMKMASGAEATIEPLAVADATTADPTPSPVVEAAPITPERAVELARQGRLAIRVVSKDARNLGVVETMGNGKGTRPWRLRKDVPPEVTAAVASAPPPGFVGPMMAASHPVSMASVIGPLVGPRAAFNVAPARVLTANGTSILGTYLLDVPTDELSLGSISTLLSSRLKAEVRFEELGEPVNTGAADEADDLLWWTQSPQQWSPRSSVPLVVEEL